MKCPSCNTDGLTGLYCSNCGAKLPVNEQVENESVNNDILNDEQGNKNINTKKEINVTCPLCRNSIKILGEGNWQCPKCNKSFTFTKDIEKLKRKRILLICAVLFGTIGLFWSIPYLATSPQERAQIKMYEQQKMEIKERTKKIDDKIREDNERMQKARETLTKAGVGINYLDEAKDAMKRGEYDKALDYADLTLNNNPDSSTLLEISSICEQIANTKPKGELAQKLYRVSDKGQKLSQSNKKGN